MKDEAYLVQTPRIKKKIFFYFCETNGAVFFIGGPSLSPKGNEGAPPSPQIGHEMSN